MSADNIDWRSVFIAQWGSRDFIGTPKIIKGQLVIDWYNDNGWDRITAEGREKLLYRDGKLAFVPKEKN